MNNNRKSLITGIIIGVLATCIIGCGAFAAGVFGLSGSSALTASQTGVSSGSDDETDVLLTDEVVTKINTLMSLVDYYYLEDYDTDALVEGMYKGLIDALDDPYSVYYDEEETTSLTESISGTYSGIGATLSKNADTGALTVIKCFEGTPSYDVLQPGDIIIAVDGTEVTDMDSSSAVALIKGEEGTDVELQIYREGETDYLYLTLTRATIDIPTVAYEMLDDSIGLIQMTGFEDVTTEQFEEAYNALLEEGMEGLIIDLRDNPGGLLSVVCDIAEYFVPEGLIVYMEEKDGTRTDYTASGENTFDRPLVVLVNGNSASASEIFAGAVQDTGVGTIVGTTTYGKGVVQQILDLGDNTALKLTISKYFTPNGNDINHAGITPDVEVELDEELQTQSVITVEEDNQLQTALEIIKEQLQ